MPLVGMRRTSRRVFGARVLRSGRRLLTSTTEAKHVRASPGGGAGPVKAEQWIELLENSSGGSGDVKCNGWEDLDNGGPKKDGIGIKDEDKVLDMDIFNKQKWGSVYRRKRKRIDLKFHEDEDKKYGKQYFRKRIGKKSSRGSNNSAIYEGSCYVERKFLAIVVESFSCCSTDLLGRFLNSVLRYMTRSELSLSRLSEFVQSEILAYVFSSRGLRFFQDTLLDKSFGICKIFRVRSSVPAFMVDFSALPSCFTHMHTTLFLRSTRWFHLIFPHSKPQDDEMPMDNEIVMDNEVVEVMQPWPRVTTFSGADFPRTKTVAPSNIHPGKKKGCLKNSIGAPRITRSVQFKASVINTRSIQKRRSTLRSRRVKNSSIFRGRKANGASLSNLISSRHDSIPLPPVKSKYQRTLKSSLVELTKNIDSVSCSANILVVESDKCYRIVGALIKLEESVSRKWYLAVKKDGETLYSLSARRIMRPCSSNRVTHDIIWREENNNWKLEFPERADWMVFKELYKLCSERNTQALPVNIIPVPTVHEVSSYAKTNSATFRRPNSYITMRDDELSRALAKEKGCYDMDSEDEEWLNKFNKDSSLDPVSADIFEMLIDAFEKALFNNPDDFSDDNAAVDLCCHLERKEVVEAVYSYWMRKRKQKRSALVRVFQFYQRRTQLLSKPFIRKKRSFKRQPSRTERSKQRTFFPVVVVEPPDPLEEQKALLKVEEAKAATTRSMDAAVEKRKRAQLLMENADTATYKAAMALRIAEAVRIAESFDFADSFFLE